MTDVLPQHIAMRHSAFLVVIALAIAVSPFSSSAATNNAKVSYNRDVRPILANYCFACHGPDAKHREGDLRLDTRAGAVAAVVVPGHPEKSELFKRISSSDAEEIMPPPKSKKELPAKEREILRRWIEQGAEYAGHWAFLPVAESKLPEVKQADWAKNEVDRFVLAELEKRGLAPSPLAEKATLIRRASLDLLGLPPTPTEVQAFINDERSEAYEALINRLLKSPHYGERWGRHWLDQARYADSNGYTIDSERSMWPYRDWVIRSLNEDLPFNRFTIEQMAGDLLPNATKLQRLASAFHRNTMINEEGGTDAEQFRNEIVVDRVNTTGAVWLGLTLGCAQCHSHKFDPLTHEEYYRIFAFFNQGTDINNRGETIELLPGEVLGSPREDAVTLPVAEAASKKLEELKKAAPKQQTEWEQRISQHDSAPAWQLLEIEQYDAESNRTLKKLKDGSILAMQEGAPRDTYEIIGSTKLEKVSAVRLQVLPHDSLPKHGPGTAGNGNFVLSEIEVSIDDKPVPLLNALADHQKKDYAVVSAIDGNRATGWALEMDRGGNGAHEAWFIFAAPQPAGKITVKLRQEINDHYLIGCFALSVVEQMPESLPDLKGWEKVVAAARKAEKERSKPEQELLAKTYLQIDHPLAAAQREADHTGTRSAGSATVMVMRELPKPRETYLQTRGDFLNPDKTLGPLTPNTPAWLPPLSTTATPPTRLDLARWLVREDNPLTPRVTVNRVWMHYFGQGLVETESDFGLQGSPPSHPELLDWLARRFIKEGWSLKKLHKTIVMSATYQQASCYRPELQAIDPNNTLLARQNRLRFDAEILRDAALTSAGLLDRTLGGPTTHPPQPAGVYAFTQNNRGWKESEGPDRYRRALYTTFYRSAPYPLFTTFDAPSFSGVCTRRTRSNTPLQALTLANDVAFVEFTRGLAKRLWQEESRIGEEADRARLQLGYLLCVSRKPTLRELDLMLAFLTKQRSSFAEDLAAAKVIAPPNLFAENMPPAEAAAWCAVARVLLNTDEFITRE